MRALLNIFFTLITLGSFAQTVKGVVSDEYGNLPFATIYFSESNMGTSSDADGNYSVENISTGKQMAVISYNGHNELRQKIEVKEGTNTFNFKLSEKDSALDEIVISGTLKAVKKSDSSVPVEIYTTEFLKKNPTPNIFEALQNVNGVRPQINCSVCNTGDIHINGLEGPYTMVLIDGMPIVGGLSTVYGLSGIPNSLIERIEIVKGPASSLYGSEAVGGIINVITKSSFLAPKVFFNSTINTWGENNNDIGLRKDFKNASVLLGINYFEYNNPVDKNKDNFTDLTLQNRISVFQKWDFKRKSKKTLSLAGRYYYEDRWGGEMQWTPEYRGGDEIYGESIWTNRYELIGKYELPKIDNVHFQFSFNHHDQNSVYGDTFYIAKQTIGFGQLYWTPEIEKHNLLLGTATRYDNYNDNSDANTSSEVIIPSIFIQDEYKATEKSTFLLGSRLDYDPRHDLIYTPRFAYKFKSNNNDILRINAGTGFRVVNLFTEDHNSQTGAREVIIEEKLNPETSYNVNLNYTKTFYTLGGKIIEVDASTWYTYFSNAIIPDFDTNPNQIIYANLNGYAESKGVSLNINTRFNNNFSLNGGISVQEVTNTQDDVTELQMLTEKVSGTWNATYRTTNHKLTLDYTGNVTGPMRLPILNELDPRSEFSPLYAIHNLQITSKIGDFEVYGGIQNIFNWTPYKNEEFIIARANDPFDKEVTFVNDNPIPTDNNPYGLTFDPAYVYASNQGRRAFIGVRYTLK